MDLFISSFRSNSFVSCVLKLCCLTHSHLGSLKSTLHNIHIVTLVFLNQCYNILSFFILLFSNYLWCYVWNEFPVYNRLKSCLFVCLFKHPCQSFPFNFVFRQFTFKVIINILELNYAILLFVFSLFPLFHIPISLFSLFCELLE